VQPARFGSKKRAGSKPPPVGTKVQMSALDIRRTSRTYAAFFNHNSMKAGASGGLNMPKTAPAKRTLTQVQAQRCYQM